jgi:hypothetical protein
MISAAKLHQLSNINADQLVELLLEDGYDNTNEPIINTHFDGFSVGTDNLYFSYQAAYVHGHTHLLQFANITVTYHIDSGKISAHIDQ